MKKFDENELTAADAGLRRADPTVLDKAIGIASI
jgi:hypothetical protein